MKDKEKISKNEHMRHRYTEADDRIIARYITRYDRPYAFRKVAEALEVTEKSVVSRYYRKRQFIDYYVNYAISPLPKPQGREPWYSRLWKSVKSMLNISN